MRNVFLFAISLALPASALAAPSSHFAYVAAHDPTAAAYYPQTAFNRSSAQQKNRITHSATGQYVVYFHGLGHLYGGNVQVSAYGADDAYCNLFWLGREGNAKTASVVCYNRAGQPVDARFTASYAHYLSGPNGHTNVGYALVTDPETWEDDESAALDETSFNSSGQKIGFAHQDTGGYLLHFAGQSGATPNYRVTTYGPFNDAHCKIGLVIGSVVGVVCTTPDGVPTDSTFSIAYDNGDIFAPTAEGHARFGEDGTLFEHYSTTGHMGPPTRQVVSPGHYRVRFPGLGGQNGGGIPYVSAVDQGPHGRCKVGSYTSSITVVVDVYCSAQQGWPAPRGFTINYLR